MEISVHVHSSESILPSPINDQSDNEIITTPSMFIYDFNE